MTGRRFLGAVLAGGAGRRFGAPKGGVSVAGRSLVARAVSVLDPLCAETVVVSGRPVPVDGVEVVPDRVSGCGPLGGLDTAVQEAEERGLDAVLLLACDLPLMTTRVLGDVAAALDEHPAVAPSLDGRRIETLCSAWSTTVASAIHSELQAGHLALHDVFARVGGHVLSPDEIGSPSAETFLNVNTREDAARAAALMVTDRTQ